jgi:hypothetical protein
MARLGGPSLFRRLAIVAAAVVAAIAAYLLWAGGEEPGGEEAAMADPGAAAAADDSVDGQGSEADGIGGAADPGVFADAPTPLAEGSSANATSATQGDEMLALPPDPPGGGRVDPNKDQVVAGDIVEEEEVPEQVRESEVRTALPEGDTDAGEGTAAEPAPETDRAEAPAEAGREAGTGPAGPGTGTGAASADDPPMEAQ